MCKYNPSTLVIYKQYIKFRIEKIWTQPQMKTFQPCISHANRWSTFTYMCKVGVIVHPTRIVRGSGPYQDLTHRLNVLNQGVTWNKAFVHIIPHVVIWSSLLLESGLWNSFRHVGILFSTLGTKQKSYIGVGHVIFDKGCSMRESYVWKYIFCKVFGA